VLDVGSGSGYLAAVLHHLVQSDSEKGLVVGIDHIPELVDYSVANLNKDGLGHALESGSLKMIVGDGRQGACFLMWFC
jgi:protein-L-isoaspartate(D-aspartate) O-methyltransferase